jgi:hypothetical protein
MSLVIDADGHVEETLADLVATIPAAMQPHAMRFVTVAGGATRRWRGASCAGTPRSWTDGMVTEEGAVPPLRCLAAAPAAEEGRCHP